MKILYLLIVTFLMTTWNLFSQDNMNPVANPQSVVFEGNARFTLLTSHIVRLEYDSSGKFVDEPSLLVINRQLEPVLYKKHIKNGFLLIKTDLYELKYKQHSGPFTASNLQITLTDKSKPVVWKPGTPNTNNLKGTYRTLDRMNGDQDEWSKKTLNLEDGILSRDGWSLIDDSKNFLFDHSDWKWVQKRNNPEQDFYFFCFGNNYKAALMDYTKIAGKVPLPPYYTFGYWWSRYWNYSDAELRDLVHKFHQYQIPLDILVIDMDWHKTDGLTSHHGQVKLDDAGQRLGWTGYTWNKSLFPEPDLFLKWTKTQLLKTTLNLHPASGIAPNEAKYDVFAKAMQFDTTGQKNIPFEAADKKFMGNLFSIVLHPLQESGINFWWLDWQQWKDSKMLPGLSNTWWLNYVFYTDMQRQGLNRPLLYHRWGGLGNHRYQIGFSGDVVISWNSLNYQPYFTSTASNVLYGYWSHDLGGHMFGKIPDSQKKIDPELYTRWMQFGVFSPVFRTHSTKDPRMQKEVWNFNGIYFEALMDAINLRYSLVPYIYTMARKTYDTGISICRPMYYDYPDNQEAYDFKNEYMFGDNLLVMPITSPSDSDGLSTAKIWLPEGNDWYEWSTGTLLKGGAQVERRYLLNEFPVFVKAGAIIPMFPHVNNLQQTNNDLILKIFPGGNFESKLYEDGKDNEQYKTGAYAFTKFKTEALNDGLFKVKIQAREGSYPEMITDRNYDIQLYGTEMPESVTLEGKIIPFEAEKKDSTWTYSGKDLTIHIYLPRLSCLQNHEICIQYKTIRSDLNGVIGKMNRLSVATLYLKNHWFDNTPLPFIIPSTDQAWLRINYHPDNFETILTEFKANYPKIPDIIKETQVDENTKTHCINLLK